MPSSGSGPRGGRFRRRRSTCVPVATATRSWARLHGAGNGRSHRSARACGSPTREAATFTTSHSRARSPRRRGTWGPSAASSRPRRSTPAVSSGGSTTRRPREHVSSTITPPTRSVTTPPRCGISARMPLCSSRDGPASTSHFISRARRRRLTRGPFGRSYALARASATWRTSTSSRGARFSTADSPPTARSSLPSRRCSSRKPPLHSRPGCGGGGTLIATTRAGDVLGGRLYDNSALAHPPVHRRRVARRAGAAHPGRGGTVALGLEGRERDGSELAHRCMEWPGGGPRVARDPGRHNAGAAPVAGS